MPRIGHTEIVIILDKSGSMGLIRNDAICGLNTFIADQKDVAGTADVTLVLFDHRVSIVYEAKPITEVEDLTSKTYAPAGSTALLDAVGSTIDTVGARLVAMPEEERPEKVCACILTDGEENSSLEYTAERVKEMITLQQETYKWAFVFLAANQDAWATGGGLGINAQTTASYDATGAGVKMAYATTSSITRAYRTSSN